MKCVVLGAGGFLGWHLVRRLKAEGHAVIVVTRKDHDLTTAMLSGYAASIFGNADEVYQLAGEVGGVGFIGNPEYDGQILTNSTLINLNVVQWCSDYGVKRVFFSSSACVYRNTDGDGTREDTDVAPFHEMAAFAREKIYAESLYEVYRRCYGLDVRIGRLHNTYGPCAPFIGNRAKSVMALCAKVAQAPNWGEIEVWGDGEQKRSYMYVDDAVEGMIRLMRSDCEKIVNIGSAQLVTVNQLIETICYVADKQVTKKYVDGPTGVHGRNSDNRRILQELGWAPRTALHIGLKPTYQWVQRQLHSKNKSCTDSVADTSGGVQ